MSKSPTPNDNNQWVLRFKPSYLQLHGGYDNPTSEYMNVLSMLFSMVGLMLKYKWCAWFAIICSCVNFANARINDESKQIISSFMLSISAVVVTYLQNPTPLTLFNY